MSKPIINTKAYTLIYSRKVDGKPVYTETTVRAANWSEARFKSREMCKTFDVSFVSVRLNKLGGTGQLFAEVLAPQPIKIRKLQNYIDKPVTFEIWVNKVWMGQYWGILEKLSSDGTPIVSTTFGYFSPNPKHVTATTFQ